MISINKIKQIIEKEDEGPTLDYKEDLSLETDGDKAQFVKDVISLANSGQTAHIITGIEDGTRKLMGIKTHHKAEQLNEILKDKSDPPLRIEYVERNIMGHPIGVVEISGENSPYIVAVHDRFGGPLSSDSTKQFWIERGTVFVRNFNMNEGASRVDVDKMYKVKYVALQADLQLYHEVSVKPSEGQTKEVNISFFLKNPGEVPATNTYIWIRFANIIKIVKCTGDWSDISNINENIPTIEIMYKYPVIRPINMRCKGVVLKVNSDDEQIVSRVIMGAMNMRTKDGPYIISLKEQT